MEHDPKFSLFLLFVIWGAALPAARVSASLPIEWNAGGQAGYSDAQNGEPWPVDAPLSNHNRAGFYLQRVRAGGIAALDSGLVAGGRYDFWANRLVEGYLEKSWIRYSLKLGLFRGAGPYWGTGLDEFSMAPTYRPDYIRRWAEHSRLLDYRDLGVEVERRAFGEALTARLFFHNANGQSPLAGVPGENAGPPLQALGIDFGCEWRLAAHTAIGGHLGAAANREWEEFTGYSGPWRMDKWFKSTPFVHGSLYHRGGSGRLAWVHELLAARNRGVIVPPENENLSLWGFSSYWSGSLHPRHAWFARYAYSDPTNGLNHDDNRHVLTLGWVWRPRGEGGAGPELTLEYDRVHEERLEDTRHNDAFFARVQWTFPPGK